jgi:nucleoside-diphosphate-sugar epimerase
MKCFMTGATGVVGRPAVRALVEAGHEIRAVARDERKADGLRAAGADPVTVDLFEPAGLVDAVAGCDAILHLATNVPRLSRMGIPSAWKTHNRLRTETTAHLLEAARVHGIGTFVKESITFTYPDCGDDWIDESVPPDPSAKALAPTIEGERLVREADIGGVVLRFGLFYGAACRSTGEALRLARLHGAPAAGAPDAYVSSILVADAATAVVSSLSAPAGTYNVVDDEPLTRRQYADAFAAAFGLPRLHLTPSGALRAVAGPSARALTASQRVSNRRFRDATGWAPSVPSAREGWPVVAAERTSLAEAAR